MRLVLLGPPGAGKGTVASILRDKHHLPHISTGDILREEMKSGSELGRQVKGYVDGGALVPDDVITRIIENQLKNSQSLKDGFMLDGFPRTVPQAQDLDKISDSIHKPIEKAVYLQATPAVIIQRLTGRRICKKCSAIFHVKNMPPKVENVCDACGSELYQRADDKEETIKKRIGVYMESTTPIIEYYEQQGKLVKIDGDQDAGYLVQQFENILNEDQRSN